MAPPATPALNPSSWKAPREWIERRVDGIDPQLFAVRADARAEVRFLKVPRELRGAFEAQRVGASGARVHFLRVIGGCLVNPAGARLNEARTEAVREVGAVGDLHQIGVALHQVQVARNAQRIAQRLEHAPRQAEISCRGVPLGHPDANILAATVGRDPVPELLEIAVLADKIGDLIMVGTEVVENGSCGSPADPWSGRKTLA